MKKMKVMLFVATVAMAFFALSFTASATPKKSGTDWAKAQKNVKVEQCYECHTTIADLHKGNMHEDINCISCHNDLAAHNTWAANGMNGDVVRPGTDVSWEACGTCHEDQMETMLQTTSHRPARDDKSGPTNRIPVWYDKLMAPHGFAKEHALTRPHVFMMIDQFVVDRAFGGRFQPKNGWEYVLESGTVWEVLEDTHPEVPTQKAFLPQTATAANPVCLSCKTADHILDWAYLGDPGKGAKWDRTSNVVEMAKSVDYALNCYFCHDPHAGKPRIIRDALIEALENGKDTVYSRDPDRTGIKVIEMGERGYTRKIALLDKPDSRLMCAQCHVEYNCNAGTNPETGAAIGYSSPLTNHFPLKNALELYDHYFKDEKFADFKNAFDGAWLWKGQHPEFETYYESTHSKRGVGCADCHTPTVKKTTNHFAQSSRFIMKETCLTANCHPKWTAEQGIYTIDSIKAYTKGRMRKAEYWLSELITAIQTAERSNLDAALIKDARTAHSQAHILWEYWTAENSDGFHNPELARESLTRSITLSQDMVNKLNAAINDKLVAKK